MKPITSRDIFFGVGDSTRIRLGDILILKSPLKAINQGDISALMPLAILVVGFFIDDVYFILLGVDTLKYSISKHTKKGLVLLNHRGKETKMTEDHIVRLFKMFGRGRSSDTIDGLRLYLRTLMTDTSHLKNSSAYKTSKRLINMVDWPDTALVTWANKHLRVPSQHIPSIEHLDNRQVMINSMIQLGANRANAFSEKGKVAMEAKANSEEMLIETASAPEANVVGLAGCTWNRDSGIYRGNPRDRTVCYAGAQVRHDVDMAQGERMVIQDMGDLPLEEPELTWGTIDGPPAILKLRKDAASYGLLPEEGQGVPATEPVICETIDPPEAATEDNYDHTERVSKKDTRTIEVTDAYLRKMGMVEHNYPVGNPAVRIRPSQPLSAKSMPAAKNEEGGLVICKENSYYDENGYYNEDDPDETR